MLDVGRRRRPDMTFVRADVTALPFDDETFDAVTMSYGLRNVANYPKALSEITACSSPADASSSWVLHPDLRPLRRGLQELHHEGDPADCPRNLLQPESYEYLAESIITWPNQQELAQKFKEAGFTSYSTTTSPAASSPFTAVSSLKHITHRHRVHTPPTDYQHQEDRRHREQRRAAHCRNRPAGRPRPEASRRLRTHRRRPQAGSADSLLSRVLRERLAKPSHRPITWRTSHPVTCSPRAASVCAPAGAALRSCGRRRNQR